MHCVCVHTCLVSYNKVPIGRILRSNQSNRLLVRGARTMYMD